VWALGVILYQCLTGRLPFVGESVLDTLEKIKSCPPEPFRPIEGVPEELASVCRACLERELSRRPGPIQLATRLERFASSTNPAGVVTTEPFVPEKARRPRWLWKAGASSGATPWMPTWWC
jgi:serine/threonine-protein kinase